MPLFPEELRHIEEAAARQGPASVFCGWCTCGIHVYRGPGASCAKRWARVEQPAKIDSWMDAITRLEPVPRRQCTPSGPAIFFTPADTVLYPSAGGPAIASVLSGAAQFEVCRGAYMDVFMVLDVARDGRVARCHAHPSQADEASPVNPCFCAAANSLRFVADWKDRRAVIHVWSRLDGSIVRGARRFRADLTLDCLLSQACDSFWVYGIRSDASRCFAQHGLAPAPIKAEITIARDFRVSVALEDAPAGPLRECLEHAVCGYEQDIVYGAVLDAREPRLHLKLTLRGHELPASLPESDDALGVVIRSPPAPSASLTSKGLPLKLGPLEGRALIK